MITISYRGRTVTASNTDTVGRFRGTFAVPVNAPIGEEHEVEAVSADKADGQRNGMSDAESQGLHRFRTKSWRSRLQCAAPGTRIDHQCQQPAHSTLR